MVVGTFPSGRVNAVVELIEANEVRFRAVLTHEGQSLPGVASDRRDEQPRLQDGHTGMINTTLSSRWQGYRGEPVRGCPPRRQGVFCIPAVFQYKKYYVNP
jgi:hypothetical protein